MTTPAATLPDHAPRRFTVSDEAIERFLVDDLAPPERAHVEQAIAHDPMLRAYVDEREASRRAFLFEAPRLVLPGAEKPRARSLSLRVTAFSGALAMACAVLFVVVRTGDADETSRHDIRTRGAAQALPIDVVIRRDGRVFALASGVPLRPGDAVRVEVTAPSAGFVSAVLVDARASTLVYDAVPVGRGVHLLPDSLVLDDVTGVETLHVVFTRARPSDARTVIDAVMRDTATAGDARATVRWHKEPRP